MFIDKILEHNPNAHINVFELNPSAVIGLKEKYSAKPGVSVKETDTLLDTAIISCTQRYDKIIGNPPYGARNNEKKRIFSTNCIQTYILKRVIPYSFMLAHVA